MIAIAKAGLLYFSLVFGAGFILGPVRMVWLVPRVGTRMAELMEMPVMLIVIVVAARWTVRYLDVPPTAASRIGIGCLALLLMVVAECALVLRLRGMTLRDYLATRDPVSGTVYYVMLGVFAMMPYVGAQG